MSDKSISDIISERDALAVKVARVEALCERWRAKRSTASAGAALRLVLGDPEVER